jgi:hypothetical protein
MKWTYETTSQWAKRMKKWHVWFAWYPVSVGAGKVVWLEKVDRALLSTTNMHGEYDIEWEYRERSK